jgi:hypothetical protein
MSLNILKQNKKFPIEQNSNIKNIQLKNNKKENQNKLNSTEKEKEKNKLQIQSNSLIQCTVMVIYSFSQITFTSIIPSHKKGENYIILNEIITQLEKEIPLDNFQISYYNENQKEYILIGKYPLNLDKEILIEYNSTKIINDNIFIKLRLRQIFDRENLLKMEFVEGENDNGEEAIQKFEIGENNKTKRAKERKIGYIIRKVYMWRKMYSGFIDERGRRIKLTLEEAADKVGISKKSLDDYLIQLRIGKMLGFNFNEHQNDKVGILRSYVRKHRKELTDKNNDY